MTVKVVTALNFSAERWLVNIIQSKRVKQATSPEKILLKIRMISFLAKVDLSIHRKISQLVNATDNHSHSKISLDLLDFKIGNLIPH